MSRSRRPRKLPKCICGGHLIPRNERKLRHVLGCANPVMEDVLKWNNRYVAFRRRRELPVDDI